MHVGLLTRKAGEGSAARIERAFLSRNHKVTCVDTSELTLELEAGTLRIAQADGSPLPQFDLVLGRVGHQSTSQGLHVLEQLEGMGYSVSPTAEALRLSRNKLLAMQRLTRVGLMVPRTAFVAHTRDLTPAIERLGGAPVIVKVLEGAKGRGVMLAESNRVAHAIADTFLAMDTPLLIQEFVSESRGKDIRLLVVGRRVVGAVRRQAQGDEYRSNVYLGAEATPVEPSPEFVDAAVRATRTLGLDIAGVDVLEGRDGPVILEVNSSPGIIGMEATTGLDIAAAVVRHFEEVVK